MTNEDLHETREFWDRVADDWQIQVGHSGDRNRLLNSDPVLWQFAGDVSGVRVLDAGCGTGYLSRQLRERGAQVTGVDFSETMIEIARHNDSQIDFRVDSCSELGSIDDEQFDLLIANYLLMDVPDLAGTMSAFRRVLKNDGAAVLVFSHPCFPQGHSHDSETTNEDEYRWSFPYFQQRKCVDPLWAHFQSEFIWFHRPLSDYWKAFAAAGFVVVDFEEPRISAKRESLVESERELRNCQTRPMSVAFKLRKTNRHA